MAIIETEILKKNPDSPGNVTNSPSGGVETLFGYVQPGDWVISADNNDYRYLLGTVTSINKIGSPDHDTGNETDDITVDFLAFDYPPERIGEIEEHFALLSGKFKHFSELPLDDVVMSPNMLVKISPLGQDEITRMGNNQQCCETFCNRFRDGCEPKNENHKETAPNAETPKPITLAERLQAAMVKAKEQNAHNMALKSSNQKER